MKVKGVEFGDECAICGSKETLEIHHIVPISKGGTNEIENLAILCRRCNRRISNKIIPIIEKQFKIGQFGGNGEREVFAISGGANKGMVLIKVRESTREVLKRHGIKGETYDVIIQRLIRSWIKGGKTMAEEVKKEAFAKRNREEVYKQNKRNIERQALEEK